MNPDDLRATKPPPRGGDDVPTVLRPAPVVDVQVAIKGALGRQFVGWLAGVCLVVGLLVAGLSHGVLNRLFDRFEQTAAAETLSRVRTVLQRDSQALSGVVVDYAYWDDLYAYMADRTGSFMDDNFSVASMRNLQVHAAVVLDMNGEFFAVRLSKAGQMELALPEDWASQLKGQAMLKACHAAGHVLLWVGGEALSVAHAPVRNSAADKPANGCFLLVRHLDAPYRASVSEVAGVGFSLLSTPDLPANQWLLPNGNWVAQAAMTPWPASLSVEHPPDLTDEREGIMAVLTGGLVVLVMSAVAVLYALLHVLVIRRLSRFSALADSYRRTGDWTLTWPAHGRDEIDNLGHSLNELVKQVHWQVEHHATHDGLTDLPNRQGLERVLARMSFRVSEHHTYTSCLLMIDLDNFKVINDGFGHDVGDALLRHVAKQLRASVRQEDIVARLGGDEFAILLHGIHRNGVDEFVQRLLGNLRVPLLHGELEVATTGSVGLAFCDGVSSPAELMRHADLAMYQAKQQGRDMCARFNVELKVEAQRRNMLEQALRQAVRDGAMQVVFQPVVDVVARRVVGMEALARWSLEGEPISPAEFIPIAEESGLIGTLGRQVLERSCAMGARLRKLGYDVPCSVNLSMRQFAEGDLVTELPAVLQAHGLPNACIRLEITESLVAQSEADLTRTMTELYRLGFEFLLDDFGTGHSSLYRLQSLPFQTIKIDRSFVVPLAHGDDVMVRTVRELARDLDLQVVAEGVETQAQLDALVALGVHRIQGYLIARPMSDAALLHWLGASPYRSLAIAGIEQSV